METMCFSCARSLAKADEIMCNGFCKSSFHLKCVHQTSATRDDIAACSQLFWMCKACTKMMANASFRQAIASTNTVINVLVEEQNKVLNELRNEIAQNTTKINTILEQSATRTEQNQPTSITSGNDTRQQTESTGTKQIGPEVTIPLATAKKQKKFWLYLSGFDPSASATQIENLVKENLDTDDDIEVTKLVPKGKNLNELTFVSFKVGIGLHLQERALYESTWQQGIIFRPFDAKQSSSDRPIFRFGPTTQ